jgi:hypothetical protein
VSNERYCIDTSFFINGWRKHWGIVVFPSLWEALSNLIDGERIFSCRAVLREINRHPWVIAHAHIARATVVTDEARQKRKDSKPPALPIACEFFEIKWLSPLDFLATIGVRI